MSPHAHLAATVVALFASVTSLLHPPPILLWNASASAPEGLYLIGAANNLTVGQLVAVRPDAVFVNLMARRGYLPPGVPLLKHVAALPGHEVCRTANSILIDGEHVADALERDRQDRPLPSWQGCFRLGDGNVFVLNADVLDSFDGRYFGPTAASSIIGVAMPIWTTAAKTQPPAQRFGPPAPDQLTSPTGSTP
jgi:conjugative transfer signal peptidase TraF